MAAYDKTPDARLRECVTEGYSTYPASAVVPLRSANKVRASLAAQLLAARERIRELERKPKEPRDA